LRRWLLSKSVCVCVCVGGGCYMVICIQVRSATYAKQASDIFAYMTDDASKRDYGTALYWMVFLLQNIRSYYRTYIRTTELPI